jgi:SAM-dependent methyltransferase
MGAEGDAGWDEYYARTAGRAPSELLLAALNMTSAAASVGPGRVPPVAVDLGCGDGVDTVELLRRGWRVSAVDAQPAAIAHVERAVPTADRPRLVTLVADFTTANLPDADLVHCGWSLPHCPAPAFDTVWTRIRRALRPGGLFAGQLLAPRDDWAATGAPGFDREGLDRLLTGYRVERLTEIEADRASFDGPKHWHYVELIARRTG